MEREILTKSAKETKKLGEKLAKRILLSFPSKRKKTMVIGLFGDLGGGKTTFLQGFAKGLGIKEKILSPTFILMKKFQITKFKYFYHFDCYRIKEPKEILDLGWEEIISNPQNIVAVEWADRIEKILPKDTISINFEFIDENRRKITIKNPNFPNPNSEQIP